MHAYRGLAGEARPRLVEIDIPTVGDDDVLVQIKSAGLTAGTFTLLQAGMLRPLPMTLGHEGAGVVSAVGRNVSDLAPGDRVRAHPTLSCGHCRFCLSDRDQMCRGSAMMGFVSFGETVPEYDRYHNGFLAEYALAPRRQVDKLPDNVSFDVGAKLHYLANAVRNLRVADIGPASTLGILGPTGSMGVATIRVAHLFGVTRLVLIGRSSERLEQVARLSSIPTEVVATDGLGEDWPATGALPRKLAQVVPEGMDAIIDYLPDGGPMWQAAAGVVTGGTFVNMGGGQQPFALPMRALVGKCLKVAGTRNHSRLDAKEVLRLLGTGVLRADDLITHSRPLGEIDAAVEMLGSRTEPVWMSVVTA